MARMKPPVSDADRLNVTAARLWVVTHGWSHLTIVAATGEDEAVALAAVWFARAEGRTHMPVPKMGDYRVRPAGDEDVAKFMRLRTQDRDGVAGARDETPTNGVMS